MGSKNREVRANQRTEDRGQKIEDGVSGTEIGCHFGKESIQSDYRNTI